MSYLLEDHQGGVSVIASNAGTVDIDESFTAFGQRRNRTTWSGAPVAGDLTTIAGLTRRGYTFQTWLGQSMGLNHMNGRVQDAILGRFLSADPHIPDPSNAQSYNRYSYVNNNPLTETDPTGFDAKSCSADSQCTGGVQGTPEQGQWSCYGPGCGGGWANSISTSVSSTNPIAAFNQWVSAATGSAAQTVGQTALFAGSFSIGLQDPSSEPGLGQVGLVEGVAAAIVAGPAMLADLLEGGAAAEGAAAEGATAADGTTVFAGHGFESAFAGTTVVPEGVALTLPGEAGLELWEGAAQFVEAGDWEAIASSSRWSNLLSGTTTYLPGSTVPNLILTPAVDMVTLPGSFTVGADTSLSTLLNGARGLCVWAACRSVP